LISPSVALFTSASDPGVDAEVVATFVADLDGPVGLTAFCFPFFFL